MCVQSCKLVRLVFDIETNAIDFNTGDYIDQVTDVWCIIAQDIDDRFVWEFGRTGSLLDHAESMREAMQILEEADEIIGHNIIGFDIPVLRKLFNFNPSGKITDTLVLSRVLYPDRPKPEGVKGRGHSLEAWGRRLGFPKGKPPGFEGYSEEACGLC